MDDPLAALAATQDQVLSRTQLRAMGISRHLIRSNVRARRWSALGTTVVILQTGQLTNKQQWWAALLSSGRDASLGGRTALEAAGLRRWESPAVHVLTPRGRTPSSLQEFPVVQHQTRWPANGDTDPVGSPLRTRNERSAIDAACWSRRAWIGCAILAAVVQQRLSTPERLLAVLGLAGPIRHAKQLRLALHDIEGGAHALSKLNFHQLCREYNLGRVVGQRVRLDGYGRRRYLDGEIEAPSGARVGFEVDGALHLAERSYWDDMSRGNEMVIMGQPVLRFPTVALRLERPRIADQTRRALAAIQARRAA